MKVLLLKFIRIEEEEMLREVARAIRREFKGCEILVPAPWGLFEWVRGIGRGEGFDVLPYSSGLKGLLRLLREIRKREFDLTVIAYEGSRWGQLKLEGLALLSGAWEITSFLRGRVEKDSRLFLAIRTLGKVSLLPFLLFLGTLGSLLVLSFLALTDIASRFIPKRRRLLPSPPQEQKGVSVVIPSRDGKHLLEKSLPCLRRAMEGWGGRWEVIVVDDASRDGTAQFLSQKFPWVRVVRRRRWEGFGPTCNAGIREAKFGFLLLLNNDVQVTEGFLEPLLNLLTNDSSLLGAGSFFSSTREGLEGEAVEVKENLGAPTGCGLFERYKLLLLEGFDLLYAPFYWEENDLGIRGWRRRWRCVFCGRSRVIHPLSSSIRRLHHPGYIWRIFLRNKFTFVWKNVTYWRWLFLHFLLLPLRLTQDITVMSGPYMTSALFEAILKLPLIVVRRVKEKREEVVPFPKLLPLLKEPSLFYFI